MQATDTATPDAPQGRDRSPLTALRSPGGGDAAALAAEAHDLEQRLAKYREWYARMAAEERRLLDALRAHRERWATGNAKGHALSARLSGIRERLLAASRPAQAR